MAIRDWILDWLYKENPAQASIAQSEGTRSPESIIDSRTAYQEIDIVNRCVDMIISACVEVPWIIENSTESERAPTSRWNKLINILPNPYEDRVSFFRRAFLDFMLDGNAFFYYDGKFIYILPANDVTIVPDPKTYVSHYEYAVHLTDPTGGWYNYAKMPRGETSTIIFKPEEIIHVKADNDSSIYRGRGKLKAINRLADLYYNMSGFQNHFFKNNAVPGLVLTTEHVLNPKIKDRLLQQWIASYANMTNGARTPAILDGGLKIDKFGQSSFTELDFEESVARIEEDISTALGVPYVLLKAGNNANISPNQVLFYNHTIFPILNLFCSAFQRFIGGDCIIYADKYEIGVLRPDFQAQATYYSTLVNAGILTVNEARDAIRYDQLDGVIKLDPTDPNNLRVPQNITGSATNPSLGGRPTDAQLGRQQTEN